MSAAGRDSPVSRKRPLGPAHGSPAARSGGGGGGGSGSPKAKRRLFAAGSGSRSTVASSSSSSSAAAAAAAEVDWLCRRRRLILLAVLTRRRRKYSAQKFARLHDAIVGLASAVRDAIAPVEPQPDLYVRDSTAPRPEEADRPLLAGNRRGEGARRPTNTEHGPAREARPTRIRKPNPKCVGPSCRGERLRAEEGHEEEEERNRPAASGSYWRR